MLTDTLREAKENDLIEVEDVEKTADLIFIFIEGAYYYLSMVSDKIEYERRIELYQRTVLSMLRFQSTVPVLENGK
jgi:hypothetical protein